MITLRRLATGLALASFVLLGSTCSPGTPSAFGGTTVSWSHSETGKEKQSGVDDARVDIAVWGEGAVFVVWSDSHSGSIGGGGMGGRTLEPGETRTGVKYEGYLGTPAGERVDVRCYTPDGRTGSVHIGDRAFDLAAGALLLVSTRGDSVRFEQLGLEKLNLAPAGRVSVEDVAREQFEGFAKTVPEIRAFFSGSDG